MAGDLEKFLQQAAERLADRVHQGQAPAKRRPPSEPSQPPRSVRQLERAAPQPEVVDAMVIEEGREAGSDPLSTIDTRHLRTAPQRPELAHEIGLADERMAGHVQHVTEGDVMHLRKASAALSGGSPSDSGRTEVTRRQRDVSPLIQMLRNPETLRAAFIAGEIFGRRF